MAARFVCIVCCCVEWKHYWMSQFFAKMFCSSFLLISHFVLCFFSCFFGFVLANFTTMFGLFGCTSLLCLAFLHWQCFPLFCCWCLFCRCILFWRRVCCTFVCVLMVFQLLFLCFIFAFFVADFALYFYRDKRGVCEFFWVFLFCCFSCIHTVIYVHEFTQGLELVLTLFLSFLVKLLRGFSSIFFASFEAPTCPPNFAMPHVHKSPQIPPTITYHH